MIVILTEKPSARANFAKLLYKEHLFVDVLECRYYRSNSAFQSK